MKKNKLVKAVLITAAMSISGAVFAGSCGGWLCHIQPWCEECIER